MLIEQQRRDEKAGQHEEEVDAKEATANARHLEVVGENEGNCDPANAVKGGDVRQGGRAHRGVARGAVVHGSAPYHHRSLGGVASSERPRTGSDGGDLNPNRLHAGRARHRGVGSVAPVSRRCRASATASATLAEGVAMTASCTERAWPCVVPFIALDLLDRVIRRCNQRAGRGATVRAGSVATIRRATVSVLGGASGAPRAG